MLKILPAHHTHTGTSKWHQLQMYFRLVAIDGALRKYRSRLVFSFQHVHCTNRTAIKVYQVQIICRKLTGHWFKKIKWMNTWQIITFAVTHLSESPEHSLGSRHFVLYLNHFIKYRTVQDLLLNLSVRALNELCVKRIEKYWTLTCSTYTAWSNDLWFL